MIVFNENYKEFFPLFKETVDKASFVSFDCEMSGVILEPKTDSTKYDTQQYRYFKVREIVKRYELIQLGLTFYLEDKKENDQIYIERTFTFYLFKNSKIKIQCEDKFPSEFFCHPSALKFLNENNFDLNTLVKKGIHYNKLEKKEKIKQLIINEKFLIGSTGIFLSRENEVNVIETIVKIVEFLLIDHSADKTKSKKPTASFKMNNNQTMIFLLGCNLKKITYLGNFSLIKDKANENTIIVEKTKRSIPIEDFNKYYNTIEDFKTKINNDNTLIYQSRHQFSFGNSESSIDDLINDELGFSIFLEYIITKKLPIIGHNIYFDMMFIYDKLIGDLPEDFFDFKKKIHYYFPFIYDTKLISGLLGKFDFTKLDALYKSMIKNKYTNYISFYPDTTNRFCLYNDMENSKLHDAGFDSVITGRCFVLMNKAKQNNFKVQNKESQINGYIDLCLFKECLNTSSISLVDSSYAQVYWDTDLHCLDEFKAIEDKLVKEMFKSVYFVKFNKEKFTCGVIAINDIAKIFRSEKFNISVTKADYCAAFVEILTMNYEKDGDEIKKLVQLVQEERKNDIIKVIDLYNFYQNFRDAIR